jgi:hypothetical protein
MKLINVKLMNLIGAIQIDSSELNLKTEQQFIDSIVKFFGSLTRIGAFICLIVAAVQLFKFMFASGQEKMQHGKTVCLTIGGFVVLVLLPSLINWIIGFFS